MAEYSIYNSQWTAQQIEASIGKNPRIGDDGTWEVWDMATMQWVDTGIAPSGGVPIPVTHNLLKGDGNGGVVAGAAESDLQSKITASGILKGNGAGGVSPAVAGTDFAPGGYGFGELLQNVEASSASESYETFCAKIDAKILNWGNRTTGLLNIYPPQIYGKGKQVCVVHKANADYVAVYSVGSYDEDFYGWRMIKRKISSSAPAGTWQPFEWVNPPMQVGVEYRTTERYYGKPVYVKYVDCGTIANGKTVAHGAENVQRIVRYVGYRTSEALPSIYNSDLANAWSAYVSFVNTSNIGFSCGTSAAGSICGCEIWYIKTTD